MSGPGGPQIGTVESYAQWAGTGRPSAPRSRRAQLLWPLLAVVIISVVGVVGVVVLHRSRTVSDAAYLSTTPDLRGYRVPDNLCTTTVFDPLVKAGFTPFNPGYGNHRTVSRHEAVDDATCAASYSYGSGDSGTAADLTTAVELHKKSNPLPQFRAEFDADGHTPGVSTKRVSGLGDSAYLSQSGTSYPVVTLDVRDGWMCYRISWSPPVVASDHEPIPTDQRRQILMDIARATLAQLRQ